VCPPGHLTTAIVLSKDTYPGFCSKEWDLKIGILELMSAGASTRWGNKLYGFLVVRQYASIMPQAVSVWCRNLGHEVYYATYYGGRDPESLLPKDLDVVFISTYTQASALAYALAKLYRRRNTLTVIGGPHARQFPEDCLRFFDVVVGECDRMLIEEILTDKPRGQIVSSGRLLTGIPTIEERMPEIRSSTFFRGKPSSFASVPLLTSIGCPNSCDFCIDWNSQYSLMSLEQLAEDLRYVYQNFPGVMIGLHDPNFAVRFEQVFDVLEKIPSRRRSRFIVETSLGVLRGSRLERLKKAGKFYVIPGIESWTAYSSKVGAGPGTEPRQKLDKVIDQLETIRPYVDGIQANFMFGLDTDAGDGPVALTREFARRASFVMPNFNVPVPFGNTPLYDRYVDEHRLLESMPFTFYYMPYLVYSLKNYGPAEFYERLIDMLAFVSSSSMMAARLDHAISPFSAVYSSVKALGNRQMVSRLSVLLRLLRTDRQFRMFHEHETDVLPEYYHREYERMLGRYSELMSREDRRPVLVSHETKKGVLTSA
jgi:radical SAM superfamily enzyme YgiQ (UPF0313 family)